MKSYITATFANGFTLKTEMNATPRDAVKYYHRKTFNIGQGEKDNLQRCISVFASPERHYN